jgi:FkbM family methyltransferase
VHMPLPVKTAMNLKPFARFLYANVPGAAAARFGAMDLLAPHFTKGEYGGVHCLSVADGLIVDVGAARGQSIAAFKKFAPRARIVSFEPEPRSVQRLISRYRQDRAVTVHGNALGERAGSMTFFVPRYGHWDCDGMSAIDRDAATEWLSDPGRMFHFDKTKLTVEEHPVECRTLDSYNLPPVLIKLHAQGAEAKILKGSEQTIQRHRPALMCAFPPAALTELLAGWKYRPYVFGGDCFTPGTAMRPVTFTWYLTDDHLRRMPVASG